VERAEAEAILDGDRETAVALLLRLGELVEANQRLEARVAELERRLNRSSRNSSLPPSQDPPSAPPRRRGTTVSLAPTRPNSPGSCSGSYSRPGRSTRSSQRAGDALAGPYTRLEQQLRAASVVNIDETGWKTAGGQRTLWGALSWCRHGSAASIRS
jgi:Family of unknown function (DUF6444)